MYPGGRYCGLWNLLAKWTMSRFYCKTLRSQNTLNFGAHQEKWYSHLLCLNSLQCILCWQQIRTLMRRLDSGTCPWFSYCSSSIYHHLMEDVARYHFLCMLTAVLQGLSITLHLSHTLVLTVRQNATHIMQWKCVDVRMLLCQVSLDRLGK